jgi:hypothetical protein
VAARVRHSAICDAIRQARRLQFVHDGLVRVVEPYCHGISNKDNEVLRAIQIRGASRKAKKGFYYGKLWMVSEMSALRVLDERFIAFDPNYNPDDSAMRVIHCRIERPSKLAKKRK